MKYLQILYLIKDLYAEYKKNSYNKIKNPNSPIKKYKAYRLCQEDHNLMAAWAI
jgi:hypothetical protein